MHGCVAPTREIATIYYASALSFVRARVRAF